MWLFLPGQGVRGMVKKKLKTRLQANIHLAIPQSLPENPNISK